MYLEWPLEWDQETVDKVFAKHKVTPEEVDEVIFDGNPVFHGGSRGTVYAYGRPVSGRYLFVVLKKLPGPGRYEVITAREMAEKERTYYKKHRKG